MIKTSENHKNTMYITDDVNSENIEIAKQAYKQSLLHIDRKFGSPINDEINIGRSRTASKIVEDATTYFKDEVGLQSTQLDNAIIKIKFWCIDIFSQIITRLDAGQIGINVFIDSNLSKHEWVMVSLLYKYGVSFFIVSNSTLFDKSLFDDNVKIDFQGTEQSLNYKVGDSNIKPIEELRTLSEIEDTIYNSVELVKVVINGIENKEDTSNVYGKLNVNCRMTRSFRLFKGDLGNVTYEDSCKLPNVRLLSTSYVLNTVPIFLECGSDDKRVLTESIQHSFEPLVGKITLQQLYTKLAHVVCKLNEVLRDEDMTHLVFYGAPGTLDSIILDALNALNKHNIIVLNSDKHNTILTRTLPILELSSSEPYFEMPTVDKRDVIKTAAASVERVVNDELFNGQTLGLYKPGQFTQFECTRFTTTFDEIKIWWKKDIFLRPGFNGNGNSVVIPVMFKVVCGVHENMDDGKASTSMQYVHYISRLVTNKTSLFRSAQSYNNTVAQMLNDKDGCRIQDCIDINRTSTNSQRPFYEHGILNRKRIMSGVNYRYGFLSADKQTAILDNIEKILNYDYINYRAYNVTPEEFVDIALNTLLNLHIDILRTVQWFMYYNESPKVILMMENETGLTLHGIILLVFLSLMGFDIAIFVPTCYNTIEDKVNSNFVYDKHIIGESILGINVESIRQMPDLSQLGEGSSFGVSTKKKQSFWSKLFG